MADIGSHWLDLAGFIGRRRVEAVVADLTIAIPTRRRPSVQTRTFAAAAGLSEPTTLGRAGDYPAGHAQGFPDAFKALHRTVYAAVRAGEPPAVPDYPTFDDGLEQALIADAITASARNGQWVSVTRSDSGSRAVTS